MNRSVIAVGCAIAAVAFGTAAWAQAACIAPTTWTSHVDVPEPDNVTEPQSNCAFQLWAWNTFLWMTQPADTGDTKLRFETFATLDELFADDTTALRFAALPSEKVLSLRVRVNKTREMEGIDSIFQAGSRGVVVHGSDPASGRALYYSQNVNPVFYEFVRTNQYYLPKVYAAALPNTNFPVGYMEFKYSWKIVEPGDDVSKFYVTPAEILLLAETTDSSGNTVVVVDPTKSANVDVALVGIHVVGVVQNHPEFIWATFEHIDNAPDLPTGMNQQSSDPVSDRDWTFYHANTSANKSNVNPEGDLKLIDLNTQLLTPSVEIFRAFAYGGGPADNTANIKSLNESVQAGVLAGSLWANYMLVGSVWGAPNNLIPGQSVSPQFGSTSLANTTMETFDQQFPSVNCFSCHTPTGDTLGTGGAVTLPALNMNISHIMKNGFYQQTLAGK